MLYTLFDFLDKNNNELSHLGLGLGSGFNMIVTSAQ